MPNNILIVESDLGLSHSIRSELEASGFSVEETADGKGAVELIRRRLPDLVVLAVDLTQGQNGYILCGKLKKDDELKRIPVVITGSPDGFTAHRKLKFRAEDYIAKPLDLDALVGSVGNLVGFPPAPEQVDDGFSLGDLVDDPQTGEFSAEEIAVDPVGESTLGGDPELDMLDAAFEDASGLEEGAAGDDAFSALDGLSTDDDSGESTMVGFEAPDLSEIEPHPPARPPRQPSPSFAAGAPVDSSEIRGLRAKLTELEGAAEDAMDRAARAEDRTRELEEQLSSATQELEASRASSAGRSDKEVFALREASNRKDKEVLRLKSELNEKDNEIVELKDKGLVFEQQLSEASGELARKDAQLKTFTQKTEQLQAERRRFDRELLQAKEDARTASANLTTTAGDLEEVRGQLASALEQLEGVRTQVADLESELRQSKDVAEELRRDGDKQRRTAESTRRELEKTRSELEQTRSELEQTRSDLEQTRSDLEQTRSELEQTSSGLEQTRSELEQTRSDLEQTQLELEAAENQLTTQATTFADEAGELRRRISELEDAGRKNEDRIARFYSKIKEDEKVREKTRKALAIALQLVDEQQQTPIDMDVDVDDAADA